MWGTVDTHKRDSVDTVRCLETSVEEHLVAVGRDEDVLQVGTVGLEEPLSDSSVAAEPFAVAAEGAAAAVVVVAAEVFAPVVVVEVVVGVAEAVAAAAAVVGVGAAVAAAASSAAVAVSTAAAPAAAAAGDTAAAGGTALWSSVADKGKAEPAGPGGILLMLGQHPSDLDHWRQPTLHTCSLCPVVLYLLGLADVVHIVLVLWLVVVGRSFCSVWD